MEDDKGLDLSLGLPCGRKPGSIKGKNGNTSEEVDRDSKLINDFKNFLEGNTIKHDTNLPNPVKKEENFFNNLSRSNQAAEIVAADNTLNRTAEIESETRSDIGEKRKGLFSEVSQQKEKTRVSHISLTTDETSTAENEDVADSEAVASISRIENDGSNQVSDSNSVEILGQRRFNGTQFPSQPGQPGQSSGYSVPIKDSGTPSNSNYQLPAMMQAMTSANSVRPLMFGYTPPGQRSSDDLLKMSQVSGHKPPESPQYNNGNNNNNNIIISGEGTSSRSDVLPSDYPSIRPGIAAELTFGGCGSYPNLPWVSTTGPGPNGKTISGVTYKYSPTQIRIVCACHGTHMSPEEFVRHASEGHGNIEGGA